MHPRYGRIAAATGAVLVTLTAVLGGMGVLPNDSSTAATITGTATARTPGGAVTPATPWVPSPVTAPADVSFTSWSGAQLPSAPDGDRSEASTDPASVPADSGKGRRVVFSQSDQRVWLINGTDEVQRSYLVSGSVYDNLETGAYAVFSRSEQAWGIDDSGTMKWFVRFARGPNAAIGFHDIPTSGGAPIQGPDELGTPQSHGCIRQETPDALALWEFAPVGTTVVVI